MCVCVYLVVFPSACACVWVCVCSGFPQSHVWGMCCLCRAGGGGAGRQQQSTKERLRQAGRRAAGRQPARAPGPPPQGCSGCGGWSLGLDWTCCHGVPVFGHVLTHTHASVVPSLTPNPTISHPQATLMPLPKWFS